MFCRKCGKKIPDDSEFCFKCGTPTLEKPVEVGNSRLWDYNEAVTKMNSAKSLKDFEVVERLLEALGTFKDSKELLEKCREDKRPVIYDNAVETMNSAQSADDFENAEKDFSFLIGFKDSDALAKKCAYNAKLWRYNDGYKIMKAARSFDEYKAALDIFRSLGNFEDSAELEAQCADRVNSFIYNDAVSKMNLAEKADDFARSAELFQSIGGYLDSDKLSKDCLYNKNVLIYNEALEKVKFANEDYELDSLSEIFSSLGDFFEAKSMAEKCKAIVAKRHNGEMSENIKISDMKFPEKVTLSNGKMPELKENSGTVIVAKKSEPPKQIDSEKINRLENSAQTAEKPKNNTCPKCGAIIYPWQSKCPSCDKPIERTDPDSPSVSNSEYQNRTQIPQSLVTLNLITKIVGYAAIAIALFLELIIARNIKPSINTIYDMTQSNIEALNGYNSVIIASYFFYGLFFLCAIIRIISAITIAIRVGKFENIGIFLGVGLVITTIVAAISQNWKGMFVLFGIVVLIYVGKKIEDWV